MNAAIDPALCSVRRQAHPWLEHESHPSHQHQSHLWHQLHLSHQSYLA